MKQLRTGGAVRSEIGAVRSEIGARKRGRNRGREELERNGGARKH